MQKRSKKAVSMLLTFALLVSMFAAMMFTASASAVDDGPFQVTENPVGAIYLLDQAAVPIQATFVYDALGQRGTIASDAPISVQWYWSYENSNTDRSNGFGESAVEYSRQITVTTTTTPTTNTVGVRYYYAVLRYGASVVNDSQQRETVPTEAVSEPARIEVVAPPEPPAPGPVSQDITVKKTDEGGNLLSGAVIALTPANSHFEPDGSPQEATTANGYVSFNIEEGYYILSEKQAPTGYNATDEKYYISVTGEGAFIFTDRYDPYETVTFVNKEIPALNKDDHFAFMQGYPDGTFMPARNMTRAEAVVMFSRLLTKSMNETSDYRNSYYPDVPSTAWYANQVGYMQMLGVLADYSRDGMFRPNDPVTRAEFATLAAHFDNLTLTDTNIFSDVSASHWAVKYINSAAAKGWITGYPDGTFKPEANITRAEVVTLVGRMLDRVADSDYLTSNAGSLPRTYSDLKSDHWAYLAIMEASIGHDYVKDSAGEHWTAVY